MNNTDFFDENDTFLIEEENKNSQEEQETRQSQQTISKPLAELVEETFAKHFSQNGEKVVDTLSKIDPGAYIKHVASLVPKQLAVKSDVRSTHEIKGLSREIRNSIDIITGRVYEHEPVAAPLLELSDARSEEIVNVDSFFDN